MELNHLKYFYIVAREGSFTQAAKLLHVVQPALTRVVKVLEENLGTQLLERSHKGVSLTAAGLRVYMECETIFERVEVLKKTFQRGDPEADLSLVICGNDFFLVQLFPKVLKILKAKYPSLKPVTFGVPAFIMGLPPDASTLLPKAVQNCDFGIFFHVPALPDFLQIKELAMLRFKLVVAADKAGDGATMSQFIGSREVDDPQNKRFPMLTRIRKDHPETALSISSNSLAAHREMVLAGLGISILPAMLVDADIAMGRLKDVYPDEIFMFPLRLVMRRNRIPPSITDEFLRVLQDILKGA